MSKWFEDEYDYNNSLNDDQEMHLLEKFQEYSQLEKIEREKRIFSRNGQNQSENNWSSKYLKSAVFQIFSVASLTAFFMVSVLMNSNIMSPETLSNSFNKSANWFFYGYGIHFVIITTLICSALFDKRYNTKLKTNSRIKKVLKWFQFSGINTGGFIAVFSMLIYGIVDVGVVNSFGISQSHNGFGDNLLFSIFGVGMLIFLFGIISGTIMFLKQNLPKKSEYLFLENEFTIQDLPQTEFERF